MLLLETVYEFSFAGKEEEEGVALGFVASCSTYAMDVRLDVFGGVELDDPINRSKINPPRRNIRRKQTRMLLLNKLKINGRPLILFLLPMKFIEALRKFESLECLISEANLLPCREEYEAF